MPGWCRCAQLTERTSWLLPLPGGALAETMGESDKMTKEDGKIEGRGGRA